MGALQVGNAPVPIAVPWSAEESLFWIAPCPYAGGLPAMHQTEARGQGKPLFGSAHAVRQRKQVALCKCDICGATLWTRTKVSLSQERATRVGSAVMPLVVEPLVCRPCALLALRHCPELRRQISAGTIWVRQVFHFTKVLQQLTADATEQFCGVRAPGTVGHIKMRLDSYRDRDIAWIEAAP